MALAEVRELLQSMEYLPASVRFDLAQQGMWASLSKSAQHFCWIATGKQSPGPMSFKEAFGHVWADEPTTLSAFESLTDESKAEVLAVFTFLIHEYTHHFDFLMTPFGVNYHGKWFREYLAFQRFAPLLLQLPSLPEGRLIDYTTPADASQEFRDAFKAVHDTSATLEALGDGGMTPRAENMVPGWYDNNRPAFVLGQSLQRITVRGFLFTYAVPDEPYWYLRPSTVLETRAIAHCLHWIMHLFGKNERAREAMRIYMECFYWDQTAAPDYRFLLDLMASAWQTDFRSFLKNAHIGSVEQFLMTLDAACWYALQAPPPMPDASALRSNPVLRFVHAATFSAESIRDKRSFATGVDAMNTMDQDHRAAAYELTNISNILNFCVLFISTLQRLNQTEIIDPEFRDHFAHVLGVQHRRLSSRAPKGYVSYMGIPEEGNPLRGLRTEEEVNDLAPDAYTPSERIREWFAFRNGLLYRFPGSERVASSLTRFFGASAKRH
jgi:hypothetical protein